jgi:hypothetical protein
MQNIFWANRSWGRINLPWRLAMAIASLPFCLNSPAIVQQVTATPVTRIAQTPAPAPMSEIEKRAETVARLWAGQDFARLRMYLSPDLKALLPISKLQQIWQEEVKDEGKIKTIGKPRVVSAVNAKLVFVPVEFEKLSGDVVITFNDKQEIVGINFPTRESIQSIAEKSVKAIASGDLIIARGNFHPNLKAEISPQQLEQKWQGLQKRVGAFKRIVKTETRMGATANDVNLVLLNLEFEKDTDDLIVIFDQQKQIVGIDFPSP